VQRNPHRLDPRGALEDQRLRADDKHQPR
jgi:hypothetical protein